MWFDQEASFHRAGRRRSRNRDRIFIARLQFQIQPHKEKLEELNDNLFLQVPQLVQQAICDSGLEDSQINQIILVGG